MNLRIVLQEDLKPVKQQLVKSNLVKFGLKFKYRILVRSTQGHPTMKYLHTMIRVSDLDATLAFFCDHLGLEQVGRYDIEDGRFTLVFLAAPDDARQAKSSKTPCLELTHNWDDTPENASYHNGNSEPKGFGHIGISVPDVYAACERFAKYDVEFVKKPDGGSMKGLAFIKDPDGYWIEILSPEGITDIIQSQ